MSKLSTGFSNFRLDFIYQKVYRSFISQISRIVSKFLWLWSEKMIIRLLTHSCLLMQRIKVTYPALPWSVTIVTQVSGRITLLLGVVCTVMQDIWLPDININIPPRCSNFISSHFLGGRQEEVGDREEVGGEEREWREIGFWKNCHWIGLATVAAISMTTEMPTPG